MLREPRTRLGGWRDGRGRRGGGGRSRRRRRGLDFSFHLRHLDLRLRLLLLLLLGQAVDKLLVLCLEGLDLLLEGQLHRLDHRGVLIDEGCLVESRAAGTQDVRLKVRDPLEQHGDKCLGSTQKVGVMLRAARPRDPGQAGDCHVKQSP